MRRTLPLALLLAAPAWAEDPADFGNDAGFGEFEAEEPGPLVSVTVRDAAASQRRAPGSSKVAGGGGALSAFDGDPATAWILPADATGAWITGAVAPVPSARRAVVSVRNGCQKSAKTLPSLAAPASVRVTLSWGGAPVASAEASLDRRVEAQEIALSVADDLGVDALSLEVLSLEPGGPDACLGELALEVEPVLSLNESAEAAAAAQRGAALAAAAKADKLRARPPGGWPFAVGEWRAAPAPALPGDALSAALDEARAALKETEASEGFFSLPLAAGPVVPAGLRLDDAAALANALPLLVAGGPAPQPTEDDVAFMNGAASDAGSFEEWRSSYKVRWTGGEGSAPAAVAFDARHSSKVHAPYETYTQSLARYSGGRVESLFVKEATGEPGAPFRKVEALYRFQYDDRGKITGVTVHRQGTVETGGPDGGVLVEAWAYTGG